MLDSWLRIDARGITVFTGKAELGQGIQTALIQVAAEELAVEPGAITLVAADTARTPNEGYTAGSHSMQDSGTAIMNAAAQAREILLGLASERLQQDRARLKAEGGAVVAPDGRRIAYSGLVSGRTLHVSAEPGAPLGDPAHRRVMGRSWPRIDIPAKVLGEMAFIQDLRPAGMVHARVVRPPSYGARLRSVESAPVLRLPGVLSVVRDGSYLAVVAKREYQAITAMQALARAARWEEKASLPQQSRLFEELVEWPSRNVPVAARGAADAAHGSPAERTLEAEYRRGYLMHGSIGPSCAIAMFDDGALTVWTHSQGVYPLRNALAELSGLPERRVRCIQVEGSGCYGHNGADDAAADATIIALKLPGRPVRVQWMRSDEHIWEPYGPAMLARVRGTLDERGNIARWEYEVSSNTHSTRPGGARELMPSWFLERRLSPAAPEPLPLPAGGGDRNALPLYRIPALKVDYRFIPSMPLRVSALRSLGAHLNVFAIESFLDELARAGRSDPVELRVRHLDDPRAIAVIRAAAERFGWRKYRRRDGRGKGFAFARYKNLAAYLAVAVEVSVDRHHGAARVLRVVAAVDSGEAVNPDGIRNQIEGGILQALSWTLFESVTFDRTHITSRDWASYPILRFTDVPGAIEVVVLNRPGQPFLGTGEAAQGPAAASLANAVADAAGVRIRELPLTAERIRAALAPARDT
ncbi:MAG TPA: molybdopterin cofactor-binding domain-containing protein [Steroidobacteraceae bacterium]|nr:molybdopterin cofactor-binding domain-containing protein [Steroidobacteraceae bacterium]